MVPIGQLWEETQEARNKEIKKHQECDTRKNARLNTMRDVLNNLLVSSDPVHNKKDNSCSKKKKHLTNEAKCLFILIENNSEDSDSNREQESVSANEVEENIDHDSLNKNKS